MRKLVTVVGARPQFIKSAPISREILKYDSLKEILIHTGQHYDRNMSDVFFNELELIKPDFELNIGSHSHGRQTGLMLDRLDSIFNEIKPDFVLVYGDTNSTLAGALAAAKLNIPLLHVEAGLRSFNRKMPEEVNRVVTDHLAVRNYAPTETAVKNLLNEGISAALILKTGDVMFDAVRIFLDKAERTSSFMKRNGLQRKDFILCTIHRAETISDPSRLRAIFSALDVISKTERIVLPLHPSTRNRVSNMQLEIPTAVTVVEPLGYFDMLVAESNSSLILTDSGGVQKEAFFHKVPCVTLRDETEWIELVEAGWNVLAGNSSSERILESIDTIRNMPRNLENLYGDGFSSRAIVEDFYKLDLSSY